MRAPITSDALGLEISPISAEDLFGEPPSDDQKIEEEAAEESSPGGDDVEAEERIRVLNPQLPHPDVVAEHNIDHTPCRSWCRWCVEGRGW